MSRPLRPIEILMVEDSPTDRLIAVEALRQAHIINNLHTVENGIEAMAYLRHLGKYASACRPDLILLDLNLPKKDGREVLIEIKNDPFLRFIPVVVLTTSDAEEDVVSSYGHHANSFVKKPVDFPRFAEIIRSIGNYWFQVVTLPAEDAVRRATSVEPPHPPAPQVRVDQTLRVLLVEDDPASVLLVRDLLSESAMARFEVDAVSRVQDLRSRNDLSRFDIVLTDLGLPDSQGLDTYRQVRSCVAGRPVIVLTGLEDEAVGLSALREGAQDYLVKGELTGRTLARAVRYAVDKKSIEDQLRQSQRLEAIGQLAAGIAHDFNNILTIIQGQSQLLAAVPLPPEPTTAVNEIIDAAERAANLTRQLLTFSRQQIMHPRVLDLNDVLGDVARMLRRLLGAHISLELQLAAEGTTVEADVSMIEQIVMNLAVNARDAMPGGGKLTLATTLVTLDRAAATGPDVYPGRFVKLTASDTGSGIAPDVLPRIFEPFFTTKDIGKGVGLGLATVFSIVQQHRGWIRVFTELNVGTRFEIFLPANAAVAAPAPRPLRPVAGGHETVLIVEDEPAVRRLATLALTRGGYRVLSAGSGAEALALWEVHGQEIDLLFTDLVMPDGLSGLQLAGLLLERRPELKVLFTSGYSTDFMDDERPLHEGVNFLQKPYTLVNLATTVRARLDGT